MDKYKLPMNLQFFAEGGEDGGENQGTDGSNGAEENQGGDKDTFTKDDIEQIISDRLERERKRLTKEKDDAVRKAEEKARKMAEMSAEEKQKAEREEMEKELAEFRKREKQQSLRKEAETLLSSKGYSLTEKQLDALIREDSEKTEQAVNNFVELVDGTVQTKMKESARQQTPPLFNGNQKKTDNYGAEIARKFKPKGE